MNRVDEASLERLRAALEEAGSSYLSNYQKLQQVVEQINSGAIRGEVADKFIEVFNGKQAIFNGVKKTIEEAESYINNEKTRFTNMMDNLISGMR